MHPLGSLIGLVAMILRTQVLRFKIFTSEHILHSHIESERTRVMVLEYYPQDYTIRVYEPDEDNSGLWGGDFAKRHSPTYADGSPVALGNIARAGAQIEVHGREFVVADADRFVSKLSCTSNSLAFCFESTMALQFALLCDALLLPYPPCRLADGCMSSKPLISATQFLSHRHGTMPQPFDCMTRAR